MHQVVAERLLELEPFFRDQPPNESMVRAFLEGRVSGRALVDDASRPRSCAIAINYRVVFFGGARNRRFQVRAIEHFRRDEDLFVVWTGNVWSRPWLLRPVSTGRRIEYRRRENRDGTHLVALQRAAGKLAIKRIDGKLLNRCTWRDEVAHAVGSASEFFTQGFGFCLMAGDTIAAEAYACFWGGGRVEIATYVAPEFRRRGLAGAVCSHLIESCEALDLCTYWCCDPKNVASVRLAAKLGFTDPRHFGLLRYDRVAADVVT